MKLLLYHYNVGIIYDREAVEQITPISSVPVRTWTTLTEGGGGVQRLRGPRGCSLLQLHSQVRYAALCRDLKDIQDAYPGGCYGIRKEKKRKEWKRKGWVAELEEKILRHKHA